MKKIISLVISVIVFCAIDASYVNAKEKTLTYHTFANEDSDEVIAVTTIIMNSLDDGGLSLVRKNQTDECLIEDELILDKESNLQTWRRTCLEQGVNFSAVISGSSLFIRGQFQGEDIDKEIKLGQKSLHIYPKYNLSKFALSDVPKLKFWSLRRDHLKKLPMQAIRKGEGIITINDKKIEAIKVYYSIVGKLREKYYNRNYYYRKSDGLYIKKREQDGRIEILVKEQ